LAAAPAVPRGALGALAALSKFAPLALAPLLACYRLRDPRCARRRALRMLAFLTAFAGAGALASIPSLSHDSLHTIFKRTLDYQANRGSPFSLWGLYGWLRALECAVQIVAVLLPL